MLNIYENIKNVIHEWEYMYKINNISAAFSHSAKLKLRHMPFIPWSNMQIIIFA